MGHPWSWCKIGENLSFAEKCGKALTLLYQCLPEVKVKADCGIFVQCVDIFIAPDWLEELDTPWCTLIYVTTNVCTCRIWWAEWEWVFLWCMCILMCTSVCMHRYVHICRLSTCTYMQFILQYGYNWNVSWILVLRLWRLAYPLYFADLQVNQMQRHGSDRVLSKRAILCLCSCWT